MKSSLKTWFFGFFTCLLILSLGLNMVLLQKPNGIGYTPEQQERMDQLTAALDRGGK